MSGQDDYWRKFERGVEWFFPRQSTPARHTPTQPTPPRPAPDAPTEAFRASLRDLESRIGASLSLAALTGSTPPTVDGRYVIRRILGRGASGVVVEALDDRLHRPVALKLYAEPSERIVREGRALAKLDHPHVLRVFDVGEGTLHTDGDAFPCTYLSMELIEGESLRRWIETKDRSDADVRRVLREAGAGLAAAHASGLVHRDFKPENVMLDNSGRARVVDFGLASGGERADGDPMLTIAGTASYMAPEQHRGEATSASDVYAFARVCVELLTGALPTSRRGMESVLASQPRRLRRLLRRALAHQASSRPSLLALADGLRMPRRWPWVSFALVLLSVVGVALVVRGPQDEELRGRIRSWFGGHAPHTDTQRSTDSECEDVEGTWTLRTTVRHSASRPDAIGAQGEYQVRIWADGCEARFEVEKTGLRDRPDDDFRPPSRRQRNDYVGSLERHEDTIRSVIPVHLDPNGGGPKYRFDLTFRGESATGTFRLMETDREGAEAVLWTGDVEGALTP